MAQSGCNVSQCADGTLVNVTETPRVKLELLSVSNALVILIYREIKRENRGRGVGGIDRRLKVSLVSRLIVTYLVHKI